MQQSPSHVHGHLQLDMVQPDNAASTTTAIVRLHHYLQVHICHGLLCQHSSRRLPLASTSAPVSTRISPLCSCQQTLGLAGVTRNTGFTRHHDGRWQFCWPVRNAWGIVTV